VTTVRDAGYTPAGIKRAFASGAFPGPRTQVSCQPLSQTGGHGDDWTPSGAVMGTEMSDLPPGVADGVDAVRRAARLQIRAGADWIKVMATGGVMSAADFPDASQFTVEEIRAIVEEAKAAGIHGTLAHAEGTSGIKNALRAGITSIEHGDLIDDEGIDLMLERDVPLIPTFNINFSLMDEARIARGEVPPWASRRCATSSTASNSTSATPSSAACASSWAPTASAACTRRPSWPICPIRARAVPGDPGGHQ